ncbi:MAG: hypothetical protein MI799_13120 [Desulfobacterales bacterium]|nr:hypothetical protein [Desulfobacterales bacterium]
MITIPGNLQARTRGILVSPQRILLEGRNRTASITMVNPGDRPLQFRIELIHMEMDPQGRLKKIEAPTPAQEEQKKILRYSPRRTVLDPGKSQTIRLMARRPAGIPDGEYRMHLSLSPIALPSPSDKTGAAANPAGQTNFDIDLLIGVTLPVFVRYGKLESNVGVSRVDVVKSEKTFVNLDLTRSGNRSASVNIDVYLVGENGQNEERVGVISGAAVYYPNKLRMVRIPLSLPKNSSLSGRNLKIVLKDNENKKGAVLFSKIFSVP